MNSDIRWKYLREKSDSKTTTSLKTYLDYIFPDKIFEYDVKVPKEILHQRNKNISVRKYRPDARCESLNLIIEVDGLPHYQNAEVIVSDITRDEYFKLLGYKVVRIPYWIQLSKEFVKHIFNKDVGDLCELRYSFYDTPPVEGLEDCPGILTCVGSMCELGRKKFVNEINKLPSCVQNIVLQDLLTCYTNSKYPEFVFPIEVLSKIIIKDSTFTFNPNDYKNATLLYR